MLNRYVVVTTLLFLAARVMGDRNDGIANQINRCLKAIPRGISTECAAVRARLSASGRRHQNEA